MTREEYDEIDAVNWSTAKQIARSNSHYAHALARTAAEDTDAMAFGRALHIAILEPDLYASGVAVWGEGVRRGKKWDAFEPAALSAGQDMITRAQDVRIATICHRVRSDPSMLSLIERGRAEVTVLWRDGETGLDCKGRLDFVPDDPAGAAVDLKTCRDASPDAFGRCALRYGYHAQAAFYVDGLARSTGLAPRPYLILALESTPPYVAQVYRVHDEALELGRDEYRRCLAKIVEYRADARATGRGYADGPMDLQLPKWAWGPDDDIEALGLDLGTGETNE
jgi:exodeoxyribonuclease VIII